MKVPLWQSTWGKWWLTHWASLLRWIWSISEYNPNGIPKWSSKMWSGIVHHKSDRKSCVLPTADRNSHYGAKRFKNPSLMPRPKCFKCILLLCSYKTNKNSNYLIIISRCLINDLKRSTRQILILLSLKIKKCVKIMKRSLKHTPRIKYCSNVNQTIPIWWCTKGWSIRTKCGKKFPPSFGMNSLPPNCNNNQCLID